MYYTVLSLRPQKYLYFFDDTTVMTIIYHHLLLIKRINTTTLSQTHGLTIRIAKQCGGTPVSFDLVLLNLEHKQVYTSFWYFHLIDWFLVWAGPSRSHGWLDQTQGVKLSRNYLSAQHQTKIKKAYLLGQNKTPNTQRRALKLKIWGTKYNHWQLLTYYFLLKSFLYIFITILLFFYGTGTRQISQLHCTQILYFQHPVGMLCVVMCFPDNLFSSYFAHSCSTITIAIIVYVETLT